MHCRPTASPPILTSWRFIIDTKHWPVHLHCTTALSLCMQSVPPAIGGSGAALNSGRDFDFDFI